MREIPIKYSVIGEHRVMEATQAMTGANEKMFGAMAKGSQQSRSSVHSLQGELRVTNNELSTMAKNTQTAFRFLVAGIIGKGARELTDYTDSYKALNGQIKTTTATEEEAIRVREKLFKVADDTRTGIEATGTIYGRLSRAVEELNISETKRLKVTTLANKAAKIGQASTQEQTSALIQFSQGLAKGRLDGEELKSVMENTPVLAKAIAQGMGVTTGALQDMGAAGELNTRKVIDALIQMEGEIDERYSGLPVRVAEGFDVLSNNIIRYVGEIDAARGYSASFGGLLQDIAGNIDVIGTSIAGIAVVLAGAYSGRLLGSIGKVTKATLVQAAAQREAAKTAVASAVAEKKAAGDRLARALLSYQIDGKGLRELTAARTAATAATKRHSLALDQLAQSSTRARALGSQLLGVMGGVPGIVATAALGFLAFSDSLFTTSDATNTTTDALDKYIGRLNKTGKALDTLKTKQLQFAETQAKADKLGAGNQLQSARSDLSDAIDPYIGRLRLVQEGLKKYRPYGLPEYETPYGDELTGIIAELQALQKGAADGSVAVEDMNAQLQALEAKAPDLTGITAAMAASMEEVGKAAALSADKVEKLNDVQELLKQRTDTNPYGIDPKTLADLEKTLASLGPDSEGEDIDKFLERLDKESKLTAEYQRQNDLLALRAEGKTAEADLQEAEYDLLQKIGGEFVLGRDTLLKMLDTRKKLTEEVKRLQAIDKQEESLKKKLDLARQNLDVLQARVEGNEQLADKLQLQHDLASQFPDLSREQYEELEKQLTAQQKLTKELEERKKQEKEHARALEETSDLIFRSLADRDFGGRIGDVLKNAVYKGMADGLAPFLGGINIQATVSGFIQQAVTPVLQSVTGALGLGGIAGGATGAAGAAGTAGLTSLAGSTLGAAALGFGGGALIGNMLGLNSTATGIGGGAGALVGSFVGGPVGSLIGGLIGTGLGGLFGGGHEKAGTTLRVGSDGSIFESRNRDKGGGDTKVSKEMANAVSTGLQGIATQLGGSLRAGTLLGEVGYRNDEFFFDPTANASKGDLGEPNNDRDTVRFKTSEAAAEAALIHAIKTGAITGLPTEVANKLKSVTAGSLEEVLADIKVFMGLSDNIEIGLAEVVDPLKAALDAIRTEYEQAVKTYENIGGDVSRVNEFYLKQQEDFITQYKDAGTRLLSDYAASLSTGQFGGLSALEQLDVTRSAFNDLASNVDNGGDVDDQQLIAVANAFLEASLAVNAFTSSFFEDRARVEETVAREIENFNSGVDETLSTADLIQPLDTLADIGNQTNTLLEDIKDAIENGGFGRNFGSGGSSSFGGTRTFQF